MKELKISKEQFATAHAGSISIVHPINASMNLFMEKHIN
jgi:hypothetical protein